MAEYVERARLAEQAERYDDMREVLDKFTYDHQLINPCLLTEYEKRS